MFTLLDILISMAILSLLSIGFKTLIKKKVVSLFALRIFLIFTSLLLLFSMYNYWASDKLLFYYGRSTFNFENKLPHGMKPKYYFSYPQHFALNDYYGFEIVSVGNRFYEKPDVSLNIKKVIEYTFNDSLILILVNDSLKGKIYLECKKNLDKLEIKIVERYKPLGSKYVYKIDDVTDVSKLQKKRTLFLNIIIILFFLKTFFLWIYFKNRQLK